VLLSHDFEYAGQVPDFYLNPGFLTDLTFECVGQVLARFNASAGDRPQSPSHALTALDHEQCTVGDDDCPDCDLGPVLRLLHNGP
jgi:hypothetical protein